MSLQLLCFILLIPRPPISPLFPYTTLFRFHSSSQPDELYVSEWHDDNRNVASGRGEHVHVRADRRRATDDRSEEHTSELQSPYDLVCRLLLEKKNNKRTQN